MQNALESIEWQRIWVYKTFKIEIKRSGQYNSAILQNSSPQKLGPSSLICRNIKNLRKMLMNHGECIEM